MLSFSPYCFLLHVAAFLVALMLSSSTGLLFQVQGFSHYYSPLCVATISVLLFVKKSCTNPLHSFLQELEWLGVNN
jgi:hypothetical protein